MKFAFRMMISMLLLVLAVSSGLAQPQEIIGEGLVEDELIEFLRENYQVTNSMGYGPARDTLYAYIDNHDLQLTCVYSQYTIPLDPSQGDPSSMAYDLNINCEHTWPQSLFDSDEPMRSDMHHLFPTWVNVNSARNNFPFNGIDDDLADRWYYDAETYYEPPPEEIRHLASELDINTCFEPPEIHKGNTARAVIYFWTIYGGEPHTADDYDFFAGMMDTLIQWHYQDPVDSVEVERSNQIAARQGNINPFVNDSTLVRRAFVPDVYVEDNGRSGSPAAYELVSVWPNPFNAQTQVSIKNPRAGMVSVQVVDLLAKPVKTLSNGFLPEGTSSFSFDGANLSSGIYFIIARNDSRTLAAKKIVLLK